MGERKEAVMKMLRHYFVSNDLDDLEVVEEQLEAAGVATPQIHVLTSHEDEIDLHEHLHRVQSFMKKDVVHSALIGAAVGACAFVLVLAVAYLAGWTQTAAGWVPFVFLAVVLLGFCTWEGGLFGIQVPNHHFARFEQAIRDDKHVFFVDLEPHQESTLERVLKAHPKIRRAGTEPVRRHWLIEFQKRVPRFFKEVWP
jgi:hypothetical protein